MKPESDIGQRDCKTSYLEMSVFISLELRGEFNWQF